MKKIFLAATILLAAFVSSVSAQSVTGVWKTIDDETGQAKSHLEIYEYNGKTNAKIVKLLNKPADTVCDKCDGDNKNKPLMGMNVMWGLSQKDGFWQGGYIMDPTKGSTYSCSFWFEAGNSDVLNVKGKHWTGLSRTQKWYRVK
jgi:uncharacterized protein (DUF2147 family)